jgi:hypothetical protein
MRARRNLKEIWGILSLFGCARSARAGMTVYDLNDIVRLRLEDISFFGLLLVLSALGVRFLWNFLAKDFSRLPKLSFLRSLSLTVLISIGMLLVLVMISGARELLTPGAWYRQGSHYRPNDIGNIELRRLSMETLRTTLMNYAWAHDERFPPHDYVAEIPDKLWQAPDTAGTRYVYIGGQSLGQSNRVIACEPQNFGAQRLVLFASGKIQTMKTDELRRLFGAPEK